MSLNVSKRNAILFCLSLSAALLITGCSSSFAPGPEALNQTPIGTIQGKVHGGQFPVSGAQIYLFAASTAGYGTNATSLITSTGNGVSCSNPAVTGACYVTTDINGNFALWGDYVCTQGQQVYMVAVGGNPGLGGTVNNTALVQMAALGQCPAAGNLAAQVPYLVINEVTTVAFAYSVGGFATTAYNVSTNSTGTTALANAFANASNIVNLQWGQAPAVANGNANSINPQAKIYALANILATCVNTTSSTSTQCANLFQFATSSSGKTATDESNAILNIAHNQGQNVANIWNLTPTTPVFTPTLVAQPADWTMPVIYTGLVSEPNTGGTPPTYTSGPFNIAFDSSGNAWIGDRQKGVVEVGPQGATTTYNSNFGMVKGVAVSPVDGTIWVSDYGKNQLDVMNSSGTILTTVTTDLNGPILTAFSGKISGRSRAYEANETTPGIVVYDPAAYTLDDFENANYPNIGTPGWISVDQSGTGWIPSTNSNYTGTITVQEKGHSGNFVYSSAEANGSPTSYSTVADGNGNVWLAQITGTATLEQIPSGNRSVQSTWTGGGMNGPYKLAVDGGNNIWISNAGANTVSGFSTAGSGSWLSSNGFSTSAQSGAGCVVAAPDPSGNLWAANSDGSVTQLLGLSTPTAAPFYGGVTSTSGTTAGNLGTLP